MNNMDDPAEMRHHPQYIRDSFHEGDNGLRSEETKTEKKVNSKKQAVLAEVLAYFQEYCSASGVHGLRYISEERRPCFERLFWITAIVLCTIGCSFMIIKIREKVDASPLMVSFAEYPTNIWQLPFPAVSLCPATKSRMSAFPAFEISKLMRGGIDLYEFYKSWVEQLTVRTVRRLVSHSASMEDLFESEVRPRMYGDELSPQLAALLNQMLLFASNKTLRSEYLQMMNVSLREQYFFDFIYSDSGFRASMNDYYPIWKRQAGLQMQALDIMCPPNPFYNPPQLNLSKMRYIDEDAVRFVLKVAELSPYDENLPKNKVAWEGTIYDFGDLFVPTITEEGICQTFNMLNTTQIYSENVSETRLVRNKLKKNNIEQAPFSNDWNPDTGYTGSGTARLYPHRPSGVGVSAGLILHLQHHPQKDFGCDPRGRSGYKVILHRPEDHPIRSINYVTSVPLSKTAYISINPSLMTTSAGLKDYLPRKRQCYYSYENHLEYFKFYSKNNCEMECWMKTIYKHCGCVEFYMPKYNSTKICGDGSKECMFKATTEINKDEMLEDFRKRYENGAFGSASFKTECDCLPSCVTISYSADVAVLDFDQFTMDLELTNDDLPPSSAPDYTVINIFYKHKQFISTQKRELFGPVDLVANIGGLLGLFCGFSLLSFVEIAYFLTLRLVSNLYMRSKSQLTPLKRNTSIRRRQTPPRSEFHESTFSRKQGTRSLTLPNKAWNELPYTRECSLSFPQTFIN